MSNIPFKHNLGDKAKDRISGLTGIITARVEHLFGCMRYWLTPQETKDGKPCDGGWFDEDSLEVTEPEFIVHGPAYVAPPGGPSDQPSSQTRTAEK